MKRLFILSLICFILSGCSAPYKPDSTPVSNWIDTPTPLPDARPIIRLTSGEWRPYTGENLADYGCDSRIVAAVFSKLGYTVKFGFFPWARGYHLAQTGEWDGTFEWADTVELSEGFYVSREPVSHQQYVFFHRIDRPLEWETKDDLAGQVIGLTSGYVYSGQITDIRNDPDFIFQEASNDVANFEKLLAGRIDIFPMELNVGLTLLKEEFPPEQASQITYNPRPLSAFDPHLFLTKKKPENANLIKQFDKEFEFFIKSGELQRLTEACKPGK